MARALLVVLLLISSSVAQLVGSDTDSGKTCSWNVKTDLPDPDVQPLYIKSTNKTNDIRDFLLPDQDGNVTIHVQDQVLFACPGVNNTIAQIGLSEVKLTCVEGTQFQHLFNTYNFKDITCSSRIISTVINTNSICPSKSVPVGILYQIGFQLSDNKFYKLLSICFDKVRYNPIYSNVIQFASNKVTYQQPNVTKMDKFVQAKNIYPQNISVDNIYSIDSQMETLGKITNISTTENYIKPNTSLQLLPARLTSNSYFIYGTHQRITNWYINTAPQWQSLNTGNWLKLKRSIRTFSLSYPRELRIYSGIHGINSFPNITGNQTTLFYLGSDNQTSIIKVPQVFWTLLFSPEVKRSVVFVLLNNPHHILPSNIHVCKDICNQISWIEWDNKDKEKGIGYCCDYSDVKETLLEMPEIDSKGVLLNAQQLTPIGKSRPSSHGVRTPVIVPIPIPIGGGIKKPKVPKIPKIGKKRWGK